MTIFETFKKHTEKIKAWVDEKIASLSDDITEDIQRKTNDLSNAIKGQEIGQTITINDVAPVEHNVMVRVYGKNLFNGELMGGYFNTNEFELMASTTGVFKSIKLFLKAGTYTISFGTAVYIVRRIIDNVYYGNGPSDTLSYTFETTQDGYVGFSFRDSTSSTTEWDQSTFVQIESGETATEYTPYVDPLTTILTRCGKNLWTGKDDTTIQGPNVKFIQYKSFYPAITLPAGIPYTFTADVTSTDTDATTCAIGVGFVEGGNTVIGQLERAQKSAITFIPEKDVRYMTLYASSYSASGKDDTATYKNIQLEVGENSTDFEEYKNIEEFTPNKEGIVDIPAIFPTMTLFTNSQDATIDCKYNRDINCVLGDVDINNMLNDAKQEMADAVNSQFKTLNNNITQKTDSAINNMNTSTNTIRSDFAILKTQMDNMNQHVYDTMSNIETNINNSINTSIAHISNEIESTQSSLNELAESVDTLNNEGLNLKDELIVEQIKTWLDSNPDATTTVVDGSITVKKLKAGDMFITPQMFGDTGNGDDTAAILGAINSLQDGDMLYFPKGHYKVVHAYSSRPYFESQCPIIFQIANKKNITIDFGESTIELIGKYDQDGNIVDSDAIGYYLFDIVDCENFMIKNGIIKGDRKSHVYTQWQDVIKADDTHPSHQYWSSASNSHERGYGITVRSNPKSKAPTYEMCSGKICNVKMCNFTGDGIITKNGYSVGTVFIKDCEIYDCNRQGISVLDSDVVIIDGCYIHDIGIPFMLNDGITTMTGYSPRTGIDVEPNSGTKNVNEVAIRNTVIKDTGSRSIVSAFSNDNGQTILRTIQKFTIHNCITETLIVSAVTTFDGFDKTNGSNRLLIPITNSVLTHHNCAKYSGKYSQFNFGYSTLTNCTINASDDISTYRDYGVDSQGNPVSNYNLFTSQKPLTLYNCVVHSSLIEEKDGKMLPIVQVNNIKSINTTINGCKITHSQSRNNEGQYINQNTIYDCINTFFNNCSLNGTSTGSGQLDNANYYETFVPLNKYVKCTFHQCQADTDNLYDKLKFVDCCFDTRIFKSGKHMYIGCVFEDET